MLKYSTCFQKNALKVLENNKLICSFLRIFQKHTSNESFEKYHKICNDKNSTTYQTKKSTQNW